MRSSDPGSGGVLAGRGGGEGVSGAPATLPPCHRPPRDTPVFMARGERLHYAAPTNVSERRVPVCGGASLSDITTAAAAADTDASVCRFYLL